MGFKGQTSVILENIYRYPIDWCGRVMIDVNETGGTEAVGGLYCTVQKGESETMCDR